MSWHACWSAPAPEAHLVKGFLEQRGVPCVLGTEGPSIYPVPAFGLRVLVPEDWLPVARKFLERRRRRTNRVLPLVPRRRSG
ncbi:MAG: DUF2007 domain-containing protein [Deltaproteobacteria bacterium]|nr:MAG: DUF2007 domain-containing protein [Deltaproteobacteria bacterium]